jgi:hypothetical protein
VGKKWQDGEEAFTTNVNTIPEKMFEGHPQCESVNEIENMRR